MTKKVLGSILPLKDQIRGPFGGYVGKFGGFCFQWCFHVCVGIVNSGGLSGGGAGVGNGCPVLHPHHSKHKINPHARTSFPTKPF